MASMVAAWPTVALGEVLRIISRPVSVQPTEMYALLGMHWYAEGLYIKDRKLGSQIQADTLYAVHAGDFVYNRLFGWKGSFGIADEAVDGCYVSNEFPCFQIDDTRVHPAFLRWYFSQEPVWEHVQSQSSGSTPTSRLRLKEAQFLALNVPLPPLDEQRRIVGRIEALAGRIAEARALRQAAMGEAAGLLHSHRRRLFADLDTEGPVLRMNLGTMCDLRIGATPSRSNPALWGGRHPWVSIADLNDATVNQTRESITDEGVAASSVKLISAGTLLMSFKLTIGKFGVAGMPLYTNEAIVALPIKEPSVVSTSFLVEALRSIDLRTDSKDAIKGATLNKVSLSSLCIPVPQPQIQERLVASIHAVQAKVDALRLAQTDVAAQLDALLPSVLDRAFRGEL